LGERGEIASSNLENGVHEGNTGMSRTRALDSGISLFLTKNFCCKYGVVIEV
jgi:hypothetical protein